MRFGIFVAAAIAAVGVLPGAVQAQTLTFDGLSDTKQPVPNGYGNLTWSNMNYLNATTDQFNPSGYLAGLISPSNVAYNVFGTTATITGVGINLVSGYFTGAWNDGLVITVGGLQGATQLYSTTFTVNATTPTLATFNWTGLTSVTFASTGGVQHASYTSGTGTQFALDNLTVSAIAVVPEPGSWGLMLAGFSMCGVAMRRRRRLAFA